jgi:hypothetical protein
VNNMKHFGAEVAAYIHVLYFLGTDIRFCFVYTAKGNVIMWFPTNGES